MSRRKRKKSLQPAAASDAATWERYFGPLGLTLILLAILVVYWPALHGGMLWDDDAHITAPQLQSMNGLSQIWFDVWATQQYYPMLHTAFWLEHKLWGDSLLGYHLVNVCLHGTAVVLVYSILRRLRVPGALLAAAIFALHPVMVESVAWIAEQKNTLSAVFYLAAMRLYLQFDESRRRSYYAAAFSVFILALLTKTVTATLPAALLVIFWWQRGSISWKRDVLPLVPFFAFAAATALFTAWVELRVIGAEGADFDLSIVQRCLVAGRVIWFYLSKLAWPANLIFIYPHWNVDADVWWQWLFPAATLGVLIGLWAMRRKWRGPLAAWLLFCGTLFPVLGFLNVFPFIYSFVADHFQYLASLGMIVLVAATAARALATWNKTARIAGISVAVLLLGTLAALTMRQSAMYADSVTLYQTTIERNPGCWMAYNNLGASLLQRGDLPGAIEHLQNSLRLRSNNPQAHNNLGIALWKSGDLEPAAEQFREALRLLPIFYEPRKNLGDVLCMLGRFDKAVEVLRPAVAQQHDDSLVLNNLGYALIKTQNLPEAVEHLQHAVRVDPQYAGSHENLGIALAGLGKLSDAIEQYQIVLELGQNDFKIHHNLAIFLARNDRNDEAITHFEKSAQLSPDRADVQQELANALRAAGHMQQAIEHYQLALRLQPDLIAVYTELAQSLNLANRPDEAVATAQRGIEIARSSGQIAAAEQLEQWLAHYQTELRRSSEADSRD